MKRTFLKLLLYAFPFLLVSVMTAFQPLNLYSFRSWEALSVHTQRHVLLPGPFYPLKKLTMLEEGDLGHGTPFAIGKEVSWETDRFGFRKRDSDAPFDVVVVGDSMIAGSGLTQSDMFTEVLQGKLSRQVYPYAPGRINDLIDDERFKASPPKVVILGQIERSVLSNGTIGQAGTFQKGGTSHNRLYSDAAITLDRLTKKELLNYLKSKIDPKEVEKRYNGMLFYQGDAALVSATDLEIDKAVSTITTYRDYFKSRGIYFVYMPIPNKETVYADFLPSKQTFEVLRKLVAELRKAGIPTIDMVTAFEASKQDGKKPFLVDDTHWSATGVGIAADLTAEHVRQYESALHKPAKDPHLAQSPSVQQGDKIIRFGGRN